MSNFADGLFDCSFLDKTDGMLKRPLIGRLFHLFLMTAAAFVFAPVIFLFSYCWSSVVLLILEA